VRQGVLAERDTHSDEHKRTALITNPNYVYEPFGSKDDDKIQRMKDQRIRAGDRGIYLRTILCSCRNERLATNGINHARC